MANQQVRPPITVEPEPIGISYFVAPRPRTDEVRFARALAQQQARKRVRSFFGLIALGCFLYLAFCLYVLNPRPSPWITPSKPYMGQMIWGPAADANGTIHCWYYEGAILGWIDP